MRNERDINNYAIHPHCFTLLTGRAMTNDWDCEVVDVQANTMHE